MNDNSYPLSWPMGWPRCVNPQNSAFNARSVHAAMADLAKQLKLLGASSVIVSSNVSLGRGNPKDKGVCCYFVLAKKNYALPCDKWSRVEDNVWAIAKHIESLRGQQRWGVGTIDRQFAGYLAITDGSKHWTEVLGLPVLSTRAQIIARWKELAQGTHPDQGGSNAAMARLNVAKDQALKETVI